MAQLISIDTSLMLHVVVLQGALFIEVKWRLVKYWLVISRILKLMRLMILDFTTSKLYLPWIDSARFHFLLSYW